MVAVDPDPDMAGLTVGLPDLPFEDGAFDLVVAAFVVNHLDDPRAGVAEMARVTAPGGRVVATIWPSITWTHRGPVDELWDGAAAGIGGIGATIAAQPVEVRERLRAAYEQEVGALVVDDELCFSTEAVLGVGMAPGRMGE